MAAPDQPYFHPLGRPDAFQIYGDQRFRDTFGFPKDAMRQLIDFMDPHLTASRRRQPIATTINETAFLTFIDYCRSWKFQLLVYRFL